MHVLFQFYCLHKMMGQMNEFAANIYIYIFPTPRFQEEIMNLLSAGPYAENVVSIKPEV